MAKTITKTTGIEKSFNRVYLRISYRYQQQLTMCILIT